ncbi:MAG: 4'-phosphopantetheinyl transferase superfamily protein [Kiritimatiellaeota bacterium]|nr:4'-phosphopantetheinyl transferase superfamily protein [Kiritimatiellota bacterium]
MKLAPDISTLRSELFQGLENESTGFSKAWKLSPSAFPSLGNRTISRVDLTSWERRLSSRRMKGDETSPLPVSSLEVSPSDRGLPQLWLFDLDAAAEFNREDWLDDGELAHARRLRDVLARQRYVRSHAIARLLLAQQLGVAPAAAAIARTATGKPFVAGAAFEFSQSHSENVFLFGLHHGSSVGVDVEIVRDDFNFLPIAEDFFTFAEMTELRAASKEEQRRLFHRLWTNHEARVKAAGKELGLSVAAGGWNGLQTEITVFGNPAALAVVWRN